MAKIDIFSWLRLRQIRFMTKVFRVVSRERRIGKLLSVLGKSEMCSIALVGFNRVFSSLEEAHRCAKSYGFASHEHPSNVQTHLWLNERARPSDYPVLFHLRAILGERTSILDIGGSAGNLFYCYAKYLSLSDGMEWVVYDVPQNVETGRQIAEKRQERRLHFIDQLSERRHADVVIISGSLHYFEASPPELMRNLDRPPQHVFINRTPVIDGPSAVTIQDAESYVALFPARLTSRGVLLAAMDAANYELADEWMVPELRLVVPFHPEASAPAYSGFYFRLRAGSSETI